MDVHFVMAVHIVVTVLIIMAVHIVVTVLIIMVVHIVVTVLTIMIEHIAMTVRNYSAVIHHMHMFSCSYCFVAIIHKLIDSFFLRY